MTVDEEELGSRFDEIIKYILEKNARPPAFFPMVTDMLREIADEDLKVTTFTTTSPNLNEGRRYGYYVKCVKISENIPSGAFLGMLMLLNQSEVSGKRTFFQGAPLEVAGMGGLHFTCATPDNPGGFASDLKKITGSDQPPRHLLVTCLDQGRIRKMPLKEMLLEIEGWKKEAFAESTEFEENGWKMDNDHYTRDFDDHPLGGVFDALLKYHGLEEGKDYQRSGDIFSVPAAAFDKIKRLEGVVVERDISKW